EFALDVEIPLHLIWRLTDVVLRAERQCRQWLLSDGSLKGNGERWVFLVQRIEWRRADVARKINVGLIWVMEEPEAAAQRSFVIAENIVCKSEPRIQVPNGGGRLERVRHVRVTRIRHRIDDIVKVSVYLNGVGLKLIAKTHVERKFPRYFPVVLNVGRKSKVAKVAIPVRFSVPRTGKDARGAV